MRAPDATRSANFAAGMGFAMVTAVVVRASADVGLGSNLAFQRYPRIDRFLGAIAREQTDRFREEFRAPGRRTKVPEERTRGVQVALWGFRVLAPGGKLWWSV